MHNDKICVYVHIPFCVRKCRYCDFPSFEKRRLDIESYFNALNREIAAETETRERITDTIYIGGGTPSCVPPLLIKSVFDSLNKTYVIKNNTEITMEMNPGTVDKEALKVYREAGVNRVSLGCQSFNDESLKKLGRIHSKEEIQRSFALLREEGFDNINLDLISSLPWETPSDMENSIREALSLDPEHISVYSLIIEEGTEFYKLYGEGRGELPDEEEELRQDRLIRDILSEAGYKRYEISNYAKEGFSCRHNRAYWNRDEYRGFGLGAASLTGNRRFTNIRDMVYINQPGEVFEEDRLLSKEEEMEEFMFLGLRQTEGVSEERFRQCFNEEIGNVFSEQLKSQMESGFLRHEKGRYFYTDRGLDVSNVLMAEFIG